MATLQQIQEAARLKRAGTPLTEAVSTARTMANPPVTPPTPTPTGQTMQGVNGETFQVAPTNAQGISTPTQSTPQSVAPVQPVAPSTPAPNVTPATTQPAQPTTATVAPEDKTAEIQAKNQAQMDLNKQKSQLAIEDRKRQAEEAKQASIPTDEKGVLNTLISGGSVAPQNTQAYRNAQFKYKNYQKFNAMTPQQLLDNMKMGEIDTETSQLLASNPNYIKAKEDFDRFQKNQSINNMVRSTYGGATGKKEEVDYYNKSASEVAKRLGVTETNAEAFARIVSGSPLVTQLTQTVSNTAKQLNELNNERNNVYADLKKQYPDLSASAIMTLMGQRTQGLTDQINALNSTLSLTQADLKNAMEMAQAEYGAVSADIQAQQEIAREQRAMENSIALSQMQFDQKIKQQAEMMNDPTQAINSVIAQYADQGIMASTSAQQHIAEFMKQNREKGTTLGQYISQMQKDFQSKPEYKAKFAQKASEFGFQNLGGGMIAVTDPKTGNITFKNANGTTASGSPVAITTSSQKGTDLLNAPEGTIIPSRLSKTTNPNNGKECGEYINDIAGASLFGDTIEQKKSVAKETTGGIGKAIVWQPSNSPTFQKYGHVGIIVGQNPDGSWKVKSSNIKGDGAISIDNVPASVALGYKTLPGVSMQTGQNSPISQLGQYMKDNQQRGPGYSEEDVKAFNEKIDRFVKNGDEKGIALAFRTNLFQDKDFKQEFDNTKKFTTALDQVQALINDYEAAGKSTNALKGMAEKVARSLGLTTDQALAQLQTQMGFTLANYIKSISGTAASDVEVQRLMGNMANISNVKDLNTTILSQVKNNADSSLKSMIDTRMYGMPEDLKYEVFSDVYTTTPVSNQASAPSGNNYNFEADWSNL